MTLESTRIDEPLPIPANSSLFEEIDEATLDIQSVVEAEYQTEMAMYKPVVNLMSKLLGRSRSETNAGSKVVDTHNNGYVAYRFVNRTVHERCIIREARCEILVDIRMPIAAIGMERNATS